MVTLDSPLARRGRILDLGGSSHPKKQLAESGATIVSDEQFGSVARNQ